MSLKGCISHELGCHGCNDVRPWTRVDGKEGISSWSDLADEAGSDAIPNGQEKCYVVQIEGDCRQEPMDLLRLPTTHTEESHLIRAS
jgi:hypothetical protein